MLELLVFKIGGEDEDYSALTFEQSGVKLADLYDQMVKEQVECIGSSEEGEWEVTLDTRIPLKDIEQGEAIVQLLHDVTDDDWIGDYDRRKGTDWGYLIVEGKKVLKP